MREVGKSVAASVVALGLCVALIPGASADAGIDVSNHNGCVTSSRARSAYAQGVRFAIVKATEGSGYTDRSFACSMSGLRAAGVRVGAYHFARPNLSTPEAEAEHYVNVTAAERAKGGVLMVLDWEPSTYASGKGWDGATWWALRWLKRVEQLTGVKPLIYMNASTARSYNWSAVVSNGNDLWLAGYRTMRAQGVGYPGNMPYKTGAWKSIAMWQYSGDASPVNGIGSKVDLDWFYGDSDNWAAYAGTSSNAGTVTKPTPANPVTVIPSPSFEQLKVDGYAGVRTVRRLQQVLGTPVDGVVSGQVRPDNRTYGRPNLMAYSYHGQRGWGSVVRAMQRRLGVPVDGLLGPQTIKALQRHLGVRADGWLGPETVKALQRRLNMNRF